MDFQQEPYPNTNPQSSQNKRSQKMATASMIMGIVGATMSGCIYPGIICGSLGIILAMLSRGGEMTLDSQAKAGLILSILSVAFGIGFFIFGFLTLIHTYGSFDNFMQEYMDIYNSLMTDL